MDIVEDVVERAEAAQLARESLGPGRSGRQLLQARGDEAAGGLGRAREIGASEAGGLTPARRTVLGGELAVDQREG
ncbi:hypothetical protein [Nannocystis sp.]|uniref:hypothetical protein n=1 Tax=Nannocystis sp. TaxID=1962667 RepID=UPI0025EBBF89|nr:hypothetical protein [Nannocystis sp.]